MHLSSCLNPTKVYNKYINDTLYVPCRSCSACANSHSKRWIDKLNQEARCWKYAFNLYLSYDEMNCPRFNIVGDYLVEQCSRFFYDEDRQSFDVKFDWEDICIPLNELNFENDYDFNYFVDRCNDCDGIPHASVRDIQNFKKRLNKYIFKHITGKYNNFRSAIVAEYGPTTFRGHYHGIIFFNDDRIASRSQEIISSCWKFGHADFCPPKYSKSAVVGYVAQYITRPSHLPSVYAHPKLRSFFLTSRNPPIGSLFESSEEIREIFFSGSPTRNRSIVADGKIKISAVPLEKTFKDRLFPKCPRFDLLSDSCRVELYRCCLSEDGTPYESFIDFKWSLHLKFGFSYIYSFLDKAPMSKTWLCEFLANITECFTNDAPLLSLYRISKRIYFQSIVFGITYNEYLSYIFKFYNNLDLFNLKQFYAFQESFARQYDFKDLVFCYPAYVDAYNRQPLWLQEFLNINNALEFRMHKSSMDFIYEESHKRCKQNGYLEKLSFNHPVLSKILNNYHYAQKCNENDKAKSDPWPKRLRFVQSNCKHNQFRRTYAVFKYPNRTRF